MSKQRLDHPFEPIVNENSRILILGSFPSIKSFEEQFYYAHPRNQFWPIMERLFGVILLSNKARRAFVLEKGIAMWDTYGSLTRADNNSSDSNLTNLVPNDFETFFKKYPQIRDIFFTGRKAESGYLKHFKHLKIKTTCLPSTSPAYAAMKREEKEKLYAIIKETLENAL